MIAHAVEVHDLRKAVGGNIVGNILRQAGRTDTAVVAVREICQHAAAIWRLPPEKFVREGERLAPRLLVGVPRHLLSHERVDARFLVDLRELPAITERIGIPADGDVLVEIALEPTFAHEQLADQALAVGHIEIGLHPHAAHQFPTAFLHALLDLTEHRRVLLLQPFEILHARLRVSEIGIFLHQLQSGCEGVFHYFHGLGPRPEPRHVDMRIAHYPYGELLHPVVDRFETAVREPHGNGERHHVAARKGAEVDSLHGILKLLAMLRLSTGKAGEHIFSGEDLIAQGAGVGLAGVIDQQLRPLKPTGLGVEWNLDGQRNLLAGDSLRGYHDRIERAALALRHQSAIQEHAAVVRQSNLQTNARSPQIVPAGGLRNHDSGAIPGRIASSAATAATAATAVESHGRPGGVVQRRIFAVRHIGMAAPLRQGQGSHGVQPAECGAVRFGACGTGLRRQRSGA